MRLQEVLSVVARYINELLALAAHPQAKWSGPRRAFLHRLVLGLIMGGDVMPYVLSPPVGAERLSPTSSAYGLLR